MAISFPNIQAYPKTHFPRSCPFPNSPKCPSFSPKIGIFSKRNPTVITKTFSRTNDGLRWTMMESLEKEKERQLAREGFVEEENEEKMLQDCWREIHGENDWVGLLDPMGSLLRAELIRYGEMAQACYDGFDFDPSSKYCGSCKYPLENFFLGLEMEAHGYDVTRYLYATSNINLPNFFKKSRWPKVWSKNANWIGYVAVSNDEISKKLGRRDITISWRGTVTRLEWVHDLMDFLRPISDKQIPCPDPDVKVESGFLDLYTDKDRTCGYCQFSAREQILSEVKRLIETYPNEDVSISITGHSLGSALAILSGYDLAETGLHVPISVFSFSGPRVGNLRFKERLEWLGVKVLRVVNVSDIVPKAPGLVINEHSPKSLLKIAKGLPWSYFHVGVELVLDHRNSPFLKDTNDLTCAHNLEAHLHLLDGALAILSGYDLAETGLHVPISVFSFSGPRVGNLRFKERLDWLGVKVLRVVNVSDIVPKAPGLVINEHSPKSLLKIAKGLPWSYFHVGAELVLDHRNSPFLKDTNDLTCAHNLEAHLHLLDGYHGKGRKFHLASGRDIALVNKGCDFLKDHYEIPPCWRQDHNKGMIRSNDGRWIQGERPVHDSHPDYTLHHLTQLGVQLDH